MFFVLNLVGLGFGPLVVGMLSDSFSPSLGVESLRWAMSIVVIVSVVAVSLFLIGAKKFEKEVL